ncbi:MAG: transposase family protein, partial [Rhodobacteraceae bacterium]
VRAHWLIENALHWQLDVSFREACYLILGLCSRPIEFILVACFTHRNETH